VLGVQVPAAVSALLEGSPVPIDRGGLTLRFFAPPAAGVEIAITTASMDRVVVRAVSQRAGFPAEAGAPGARPPEAMAKPGMMAPWDVLLESDTTIVARTSTR
jgi:hypothetical protein